MSQSCLQRAYLLHGLDRILYSSAPDWAEGTFEQTEDGQGHLVLRATGLDSASQLQDAIRLMDEQAERFRLAISRRTGCPLTLRLTKSEEPSFDPPGIISGRSSIRLTASARITVVSQEPPAEMEQLAEAAARWVQTLAETKAFAAHPDEILKRIYLLIEELLDIHGACLTDKERRQVQEVRWVRDFVSHPSCNRPGVCAFIAPLLPSAVIATDPIVVQFDRTQLEHGNFVGRYDPIARVIAHHLLSAAIAELDNS